MGRLERAAPYAGFVALSLTAAIPWQPHGQAPGVWIGAGSARACNGALTVTYDRQVLVGRTWTLPDRDDSKWVLSVHDYSGRFQDPRNPRSDGRWFEAAEYGAGPVVSGGEHTLRWGGLGRALGNGAHIDKARVTRSDGTGVTSVPVAIDYVCGDTSVTAIPAPS